MMTNGDFAMFAMRLASRAASWAGDTMILSKHRNDPMRQESADRFLKDQRQILDWIEEQTREPLPHSPASPLPSHQSNPQPGE